MSISTALYQPDMPQNVGAMMRLCACLSAELHIIEPCGFLWKEKEFKRSAMDYRALVNLTRHSSYNRFKDSLNKDHRVILMSTKGAKSLYNFTFKSGDIILMGQESCGVPEELHQSIEHRIFIPMDGAARSLNIVNAASIALGEATRQLIHQNAC